MAVNAINNSAGLDRIILTFLVFGVYLRMTKINTLLLSITKRAETICVVTKEVRCL